jgi:uncharacterized protein (TIGR00106 family)
VITVIVAEFSVVPVGTGTPGVSKYVKKALKTIEDGGLKVYPGAMSTVLEAGDIDSLFDAVKRAHEVVFDSGVERVLTSLKIDDRRDRELSVESKLSALK